MSNIAIETRFGSQATYSLQTSASYDSTKLGLGTLIKQYTGATANDKFVGPIINAITRPFQQSPAIAGGFPQVVSWSPTLDWVFLSDGNAAAVTRTIQLYTFDRTTSTFNWQGYVTLNIPFVGTQGTYVVRGFQMGYDLYTTGSATVTGTSVGVTGSGGTAWSGSGLTIGSRIGFGQTDPTKISTWYEIATITSDSIMTLTSTSPATSSASYVVEDLRAYHAFTNATTATNGGLFVTKGLKFDGFTSGGITIITGSTQANLRATYWLKAATAEIAIAPIGIALEAKTTWASQSLYMLETVANPFVYKYNTRLPLQMILGGQDTGSFLLRTGAGGAPTGAPTQNNNLRLVTAAHGAGSGSACLYFTTATRIYRTTSTSNIISGSLTWLSDNMLELPPGTTSTFTATGTINNIDYSPGFDRFIVHTSGRSYIVKYGASAFDRIFLSSNSQTNQLIADSTLPVFPSAVIAPFCSTVAGGMMYLMGIGTTALTNFFYAIPLEADWMYAATTNQRVVLPALSTPGATTYSRIYTNVDHQIGGDTTKELGISVEPIRVYYRTSGITDNSGSWNLADESGDLNIPATTSIQCMIEYRILGTCCIPARVYSVCLVYADDSTDSHYQPSVGNSSLTSKIFAWRFATAFGSTVPRLKVTLYDAVNGTFLTTDDSTTQGGTWAKSLDNGSTWGAYDTSDKVNTGSYIRFTPASLGDNIRVRAVLAQY